ncbi:transcriptional regulator [Rhodosalinus halophilus]|uniref:Transcriptional regulator n=2 Tax=Rhodosalinus halophilus TaxID=2259333 RepID=A0A365UBA1_9RHOB|nr:transcriptional regulator [Rhodosalinus halophilus]
MTKPMNNDITHHLSPQLLMAYSAGTLPEAFDLIVASHLSLCDQCRAEAESYDAVGGALLEDEPTAEMAEDSLAATLRMIRMGGEPDEPAPARPGTHVLPRPIRDYVGGDLDAVRWQNVGRGVRQALLPVNGDARARLLHIPAGTAVPDHGHQGLELTLVLRGAFSDTDGRFGPGDVEIADQEIEHTPVAEEGEDCICLAVTDAPLRFSGLMPRLAQPFLKI